LRSPSALAGLLEGGHAHASVTLYNLTNQVLARHGDVFVASAIGIASAAVGSYGLAFQVTASANQFLLLGVGALGLSRLSEYGDDRWALAGAWARLTRAAATLALGPLCFIVLMAPELAAYTVGDKYPDFPGLLQALAAAQWAARVTGGGTNIKQVTSRAPRWWAQA
jgi:hypothetical protein